MTTDHAPSSRGHLLSLNVRRLCISLGIIGGITFLYGLIFGDETRAWQILLVNFLFFGGLAQSGVVISAIMQTTSARWGRGLKRTAEATVAFLPVSLILLVVLLAGTAHWAPWAQQPIAAKLPWLNVPFFVVRQLIAFLCLSTLSLLYVYRSLRPDIGLQQEAGEQPVSRITAKLIKGWRGTQVELHAGQRSQNRLAVCVLITYGWGFTLLAFDFVMALDPHWFSTLFGGYYFIGNIFVGLAFLSVIATWGRKRLGIEAYVGPEQFHDVGKLLFGFCMLFTYMFWSQYLVIWYGDLPEETEFLYHRLHGVWRPIMIIVFAMTFFIPFVALLGRTVKRQPSALLAVAMIICLGMWLERFVLVVPSLWQSDSIPFGLPELLITAGITGVFGYCYASFLSHFPAIPVSDPKLATIDPQHFPE